MRMLDVNVLTYAFRRDAPAHRLGKAIVETLLAHEAPFGVSDLVLSGFLRIVTHPKVFSPPSRPAAAWAFAEAIRAAPNAVLLRPGERHWRIFTDLCRRASLTGNEIPDAYYASLAIEWDCEWITSDKRFGQFPGLRWQYVFDPSFKL